VTVGCLKHPDAERRRLDDADRRQRAELERHQPRREGCCLRANVDTVLLACEASLVQAVKNFSVEGG
jgi:hypothetical protein